MERLRPEDPEQIGPWQIINRLGSGGMGIVYMGTNGTHATAIKIVRDFLLEDPSAKARLAREVSILKKVKSKYVAEIVGSDINSKPAWIATNYVDGPSLKTLVENQGPLSEEKWLDLAKGLMSALASIHALGVVHRDVKPSNILLSANGPRLIDFGISFSSEATSLTRTGMVAGTPAWFAPEQFETGKITPSVDNFAAGSVLYFAATGVNPWGNEDGSVANIMHSILNREPDLSLLTPMQEKVISSLLNKSPKSRANAQEIVTEVESTAGATKSLGVTPARNRSRLIVAGIVSLLLAAAGAFAYSNFMGDSNEESSESVIEVERTWEIDVAGDKNVIKGTGDTFSFFLCDQGVIKRTLNLRELTIPQSKPQPTVDLFTSDERCGTDFDTIFIEGTLDDLKQKRSYILAGTTRTGFVLQYEFEVSQSN